MARSRHRAESRFKRPRIGGLSHQWILANGPTPAAPANQAGASNQLQVIFKTEQYAMLKFVLDDAFEAQQRFQDKCKFVHCLLLGLAVNSFDEIELWRITIFNARGA
jgi:hypothetical protein